MKIVVGVRRHEPFLTRRPPSAYLFLKAAGVCQTSVDFDITEKERRQCVGTYVEIDRRESGVEVMNANQAAYDAGQLA
jgi:hypothetical protein